MCCNTYGASMKVDYPKNDTKITYNVIIGFIRWQRALEKLGNRGFLTTIIRLKCYLSQ